jgi:hypothetical protein
VNTSIEMPTVRADLLVELVQEILAAAVLVPCQQHVRVHAVGRT